MRALLSVSLSLSLLACQQVGAEPESASTASSRLITSPEGDVGEVVTGNSAFAWALYGELLDDDGNLFFSPFSVSAALGMTSAGARGQTATEMSQVLGKSLPEADWHATFGALVDDLDGDKGRGYRLDVANRLFGQRGYDFEQKFLDICRNDWNAPLEEVNWETSWESGRATVNDWVSDRTAGRIPELLPKDSVGPKTRLVLANAIYFLADWFTAFATAATEEETFTRLDGSKVAVDMMWLKTDDLADHRVTGRLSPDGTAAVARLPYLGDEIAAYVVVPTEIDGLPAIEAQLSAGWFDDAIAPMGTPSNPMSDDVRVGLPTFEMRWTGALRPALEALGMERPFEEQGADLTGIADIPERPLYLDDVYHQAWIKVDEAGTEAAAATASAVDHIDSSGPEPVIVNVVADRPFLLVIRDDLTGSLLFLTRVMDPTAK